MHVQEEIQLEIFAGPEAYGGAGTEGASASGDLLPAPPNLAGVQDSEIRVSCTD